jgi:hypothetical protein
MYCPKCGVQNVDNIKYCRSCGDSLTIVSQAMKRHLPVFLASKLDAHIARKNERMRRDGVLCTVSGTIFLVFGIKALLLGAGLGSSTVLVNFILCFIFYLQGAWDLVAFKRSREIDQASPNRLQPKITGELSSERAENLPPASVTESTTRRLDTSIIEKSGNTPRQLSM